MTNSTLRSLTRKALALCAKKHQIPGRHEMSKDELVAALAAHFRRHRARNGSATRAPSSRTLSGQGATVPTVEREINGRQNGKSADRALGGKHRDGRSLLKPAVREAAKAPVHDRLFAESLDPCWIHVSWTLSRGMLCRAEAALGTQWHRAIPILRLFDMTGDAGAPVQTRVCDVEIRGDVDHWYLPVENTLRTYKVQIGYRAPSGLFFVMAHSNRVQSQRPDSHSLKTRMQGARHSSSDRAAQGVDFEKVPSYDLRSLPASKAKNGTRPVDGGDEADAEGTPAIPCPIELRLHAELILHGTTDPHAELTMLGDRIPVSVDGAFAHRLSLAEGRQVIDAVVTTRNGCHQRTIVLGIERNTKELEPQWFDEIER